MASARNSMHGRRRLSTLTPRRWRAAVSVALVVAVGATAAIVGGALPAQASVLDKAVPKVVTDPERLPVELGMRFTSAKNGTVDGISYYRGPANAGPHTGSLWDSTGKRLATVAFTNETATGWQTAKFAKPITITAGKGYVTSYLAPKGGYSDDVHYFSRAKTVGDLTVPAGGGVYTYGKAGGYPTSNWFDSNYYVDVLFTAAGGPTTTPTPSTTPKPTVTPKPSQTPTPTGTPTKPPTTTPPPTSGGGSSSLNLPRIAWEGGSDYWSKFAKPKAAGWTDPGFFPIVAWWDTITTDSQVQYDKSLGINSYMENWDGTPYSLFEKNNVFWIGGKLNNTFTDSSTNWVGDFLGDEVDGRYSTSQGQALLQQEKDKYGDDGRFKYANFTKMTIADMATADAQKYINSYTDAVSLDQYWYTVPDCSWTPYRDPYITPILQSNCRTASSYGKNINSLQKLDAADGKLQPVWGFVENLNGGSADVPSVTIKPDQVKGAVMNSIINEARGIVYFNQSLNGSCQTGNAIRDSQNPNFCGAAQIAAMKAVNSQVKSLASVINTQSYSYSFGTGLDTMLKVKDGYAYIFSMVDGASSPGSRTFTLPAGVNGTSVQVVDENRTLTATGGKFTDTFASESSYHIYKVALG